MQLYKLLLIALVVVAMIVSVAESTSHLRSLTSRTHGNKKHGKKGGAPVEPAKKEKEDEDHDLEDQGGDAVKPKKKDAEVQQEEEQGSGSGDAAEEDEEDDISSNEHVDPNDEDEEESELPLLKSFAVKYDDLLAKADRIKDITDLKASIPEFAKKYINENTELTDSKKHVLMSLKQDMDKDRKFAKVVEQRAKKLNPGFFGSSPSEVCLFPHKAHTACSKFDKSKGGDVLLKYQYCNCIILNRREFAKNRVRVVNELFEAISDKDQLMGIFNRLSLYRYGSNAIIRVGPSLHSTIKNFHGKSKMIKAATSDYKTFILGAAYDTFVAASQEKGFCESEVKREELVTKLTSQIDLLVNCFVMKSCGASNGHVFVTRPSMVIPGQTIAKMIASAGDFVEKAALGFVGVTSPAKTTSISHSSGSSSDEGGAISSSSQFTEHTVPERARAISGLAESLITSVTDADTERFQRVKEYILGLVNLITDKEKEGKTIPNSSTFCSSGMSTVKLT